MRGHASGKAPAGQAPRRRYALQVDRVDLFIELLRKWNDAVRLTGDTSEPALRRHIAEARTVLSLLGDGVRIVDIGSGGGFPAVPIALDRDDVQITLVEPIAKKVAFLRECKRTLGLDNVRVVRGRDEDLLDRDDFELQDVAISQATFSPLEWIRRGRQLVHDGGLVIAMLGANREELEDADLDIEIQETEIEGAPPRALAIHRVVRST